MNMLLAYGKMPIVSSNAFRNITEFFLWHLTKSPYACSSLFWLHLSELAMSSMSCHGWKWYMNGKRKRDVFFSQCDKLPPDGTLMSKNTPRTSFKTLGIENSPSSWRMKRCNWNLLESWKYVKWMTWLGWIHSVLLLMQLLKNAPNPIWCGKSKCSSSFYLQLPFQNFKLVFLHFEQNPINVIEYLY